MSTAAPLQTQTAKPQPVSSSTHAGLLLQRNCACGSPTTSFTGECAECTSKRRLQTKLTIGASNDPLEQEADRVADQVLAAPAHSAVSDVPPRIQRFTEQATSGSDTAPASVDRVLASSGRPLEADLRQDMEQRFGHDFSRVRVHSGAAAEQSAREVSANAYAVGPNIVFGAGRFAPGTHEGRRLIAHELAHTIQQSAGRILHTDVRQEQFSKLGGRLVQRDGEFNVPTLDQMYNNAVQASRQTGNWQDAAEKLNGFNHQDIQKRLDALTVEEIGRIHLGAIDNPRVGPDSNVAQLTIPGTPRASTVPQEEQASKAPLDKIGPEFVSANYAEVKNDPQYIDNFTNDIKDAWYPNDRVFLFQYPNGTVLKIGLPDLLRPLSVPSDLNPQPSEADLRKRYKIPQDLKLPESTSPTPFIAIAKASFYRDKESGVIFPQGDIVQTHLHRIADAAKQIESTRVNEELWQAAAPKLLQVITNLEWGAPRGFGTLIVSVGRRLKSAAKAAKGLIKPGPAKAGTTIPPHSAAHEPSVPLSTGKGPDPIPPGSAAKPKKEFTAEEKAASKKLEEKMVAEREADAMAKLAKDAPDLQKEIASNTTTMADGKTTLKDLAQENPELLKNMYARWKQGVANGEISKPDFGKYVKGRQSEFRGRSGELEDAFKRGPNEIMVKAPKTNVNEPGTDSISYDTAADRIKLLDNKSVKPDATVSKVSALEKNLPKNLGDDIADIKKIAGTPGVPKEIGDKVLPRLEAAKAEIDAYILKNKLIPEQMGTASVQTDFGQILDKHGIDRVITFGGAGQGARISGKLSGPKGFKTE